MPPQATARRIPYTGAMTATLPTPFQTARVQTQIKPALDLDFSKLPSPCFVLDEARLRRNIAEPGGPAN